MYSYIFFLNSKPVELLFNNSSVWNKRRKRNWRAKKRKIDI